MTRICTTHAPFKVYFRKIHLKKLFKAQGFVSLFEVSYFIFPELEEQLIDRILIRKKRNKISGGVHQEIIKI